MRLLQVSLRTMLVYAVILVAVSIPVSFFAIQEILNEEVDETLTLHSDQFIRHIKSFEYLEDLEMDIGIWDQLSYDITVTPSTGEVTQRTYSTLSLYDSAEHEQKPYRVLVSPLLVKGKPYLLTNQMSLLDNDELVITLVGIQGILLVLLAAGLLILNRRLSARLWRPFYDTLSQLKAFEIDKTDSIQTSPTNITEFDDLNKTVSHLTDRSRKAFLQQKEFIENASHELQTPLAVFQSKLDMLIQDPEITESIAGHILGMEETAKRMSRLNKNLLLLSKIDNEQFTELEELDFADIASKLIHNLGQVAQLNNLVVNIDIRTLRLTANKTLIEILMTNLFHNAMRHTSSGGSISISLIDRRLEISNTGPPLTISPERMFQRFAKETNNENSTGLGLAIVRKICESSGYTVEYRYDLNCHKFIVSF